MGIIDEKQGTVDCPLRFASNDNHAETEKKGSRRCEIF